MTSPSVRPQSYPIYSISPSSLSTFFLSMVRDIRLTLVFIISPSLSPPSPTPSLSLSLSISLSLYLLSVIRPGYRNIFVFMIYLPSVCLSLSPFCFIVLPQRSQSIVSSLLSLVPLSSIYGRALCGHCIRCLVLWTHTVIEAQEDLHKVQLV